MKVYIDDPVKRMDNDKKETQLNDDVSIRFEIGTKKFTCSYSAVDDGLEITSLNFKGNDTIRILPKFGNQIIIV